MAGSEKTGFANATDTLLENAYYLLTPMEENRTEDIALMKELVSFTDAECVILSPTDHDRITAAISHVPHIIAAMLVNMVRNNDNEEENMKSFAAGGSKILPASHPRHRKCGRISALPTTPASTSFLPISESSSGIFNI